MPAKKEKEQPIDGILVHLVPVENGHRLDVEALGSVKPTELPTLLKIAASHAEEQLLARKD